MRERIVLHQSSRSSTFSRLLNSPRSQRRAYQFAQTTGVRPPEVRYTKSGDVNIAYAVIGDGPFDILFVGGWVVSTLEGTWDGPPALFLDRLATIGRVILFDKRRNGRSGRVARVAGIPNLETLMDDVRAVMDAAGSKRAAIIGVSEGGPMTILFAATYPERVAAAVLFGTGASFTKADDYPWRPDRDARLEW